MIDGTKPEDLSWQSSDLNNQVNRIAELAKPMVAAASLAADMIRPSVAAANCFADLHWAGRKNTESWTADLGLHPTMNPDRASLVSNDIAIKISRSTNSVLDTSSHILSDAVRTKSPLESISTSMLEAASRALGIDPQVSPKTDPKVQEIIALKRKVAQLEEKLEAADETLADAAEERLHDVIAKSRGYSPSMDY